MFKKIIATVALLILVSWAGGFLVLLYAPPFVGLSEKGRFYAKKIAHRASSIIYREATLHNPPGDVVPDGIDDKVKQEIKETL